MGIEDKLKAIEFIDMMVDHAIGVQRTRFFSVEAFAEWYMSLQLSVVAEYNRRVAADVMHSESGREFLDNYSGQLRKRVVEGIFGKDNHLYLGSKSKDEFELRYFQEIERNVKNGLPHLHVSSPLYRRAA